MGASIPSGLMKPVFRGIEGAPGGACMNEDDLAGMSSWMSICAVFVRAFFPSARVEIGPLNPEIDFGLFSNFDRGFSS